MKHVAFISPYCLIDYSSGAAIATGACLELLARCGFRCQAYCAARLDFNEEVCFEETLSQLRLPYEVRKVAVGPHRMKLLFTRTGNLPVTVFRNQFTRTGPVAQEIRAFLAGCERFLERNRPDVILTYGGGPLGDAIMDLAKRRDIPVVFALKNLAYGDICAFRDVDYVFVPSKFSRDYYWQTLRLNCMVLPNVIDPDRVRAERDDPQYLTFVNPQPMKGLFVFARIAEQLARRRPDISILIVESRSRARTLERTGVDLSWAKSLFRMANTIDPRKFYGVTKVLLMPSVVNETFGLAAAEPLLGSNTPSRSRSSNSVPLSDAAASSKVRCSSGSAQSGGVRGLTNDGIDTFQPWTRLSVVGAHGTARIRFGCRRGPC